EDLIEFLRDQEPRSDVSEF
ncbi:hypothetical protein A2U01_0064468, partial [Trifolium medium]|nr:hypothetical protein [Trifolium medium]